MARAHRIDPGRRTRLHAPRLDGSYAVKARKPSVSGGTVYTVHRVGCIAAFGPAFSFPGPLDVRKLRSMLNVKLCARCNPDRGELVRLAGGDADA